MTSSSLSDQMFNSTGQIRRSAVRENYDDLCLNIGTKAASVLGESSSSSPACHLNVTQKPIMYYSQTHTHTHTSVTSRVSDHTLRALTPGNVLTAIERKRSANVLLMFCTRSAEYMPHVTRHNISDICLCIGTYEYKRTRCFLSPRLTSSRHLTCPNLLALLFSCGSSSCLKSGGNVA